MATSLAIQLGLEDLLADLHYARRCRDLGRLALLVYCEVKNWARRAGKPDIADDVSRIFTESPCVCKEEFLLNIDSLIVALECYQKEWSQTASGTTPVLTNIKPISTQHRP